MIETGLVNMVLVFIPGTVWNRLDGKGDYCCAVWFSNICDAPVFTALRCFERPPTYSQYRV
jgi:hypothetical protein